MVRAHCRIVLGESMRSAAWEQYEMPRLQLVVFFGARCIL